MAHNSSIAYCLIGCYTDSTNKYGLHLCEFLQGNLVVLSSVDVSNASYICCSQDGNLIFTTNENHSDNDAVTMLSLDQKTKTLSIADQVNTGGADPCYIVLNARESHLCIANYSDGSFNVVSTGEDVPRLVNVQRIVESVAGSSQDGVASNMHCTVFSPGEKYLLTANLGLDTLSVYAYNEEEFEAPIDANAKFVYSFPPGTGPRHILFADNNHYLYVVGELDASIHVFKWTEDSLEFIQSEPLMAETFSGKNSAADVHISPDGKFIYVSNRGDANSIIIFEIDPISGRLVLAGREETLGSCPRNFSIDPSGKYLLVAHQESNGINIFGLDNDSGLFTNMKGCYNVNKPVCIKFL